MDGRLREISKTSPRAAAYPGNITLVVLHASRQRASPPDAARQGRSPPQRKLLRASLPARANACTCARARSRTLPPRHTARNPRSSLSRHAPTTRWPDKRRRYSCRASPLTQSRRCRTSSSLLACPPACLPALSRRCRKRQPDFLSNSAGKDALEKWFKACSGEPRFTADAIGSHMSDRRSCPPACLTRMLVPFITGTLRQISRFMYSHFVYVHPAILAQRFVRDRGGQGYNGAEFQFGTATSLGP